jgi:hypothetical protein
MKRFLLAFATVSAFAADVRLPEYTKTTLANGAVVYMVRKPAAGELSRDCARRRRIGAAGDVRHFLHDRPIAAPGNGAAHGGPVFE